jgi:DNA-directed RNA polymerase specialized sigma24 family protein
VQDDEEAEAGEGRFASEEEVRAVIKRLDSDDLATARITAAATIILRRHPRLADTGPQDLVHEAILRALDGRRRWHPDKIGFLGFLFGALRSIASNATRVVAMTTIQVDSIEALSIDGDSWVAKSAEPTPSTEDLAIENEQRALDEARLEAFHRELAADPKATAIYEQLCLDVPKREIRVSLGMTDTEFWTADRRLSRLIYRTFKIESQHK